MIILQNEIKAISLPYKVFREVGRQLKRGLPNCLKKGQQLASVSFFLGQNKYRVLDAILRQFHIKTPVLVFEFLPCFRSSHRVLHFD